MDEKTARALNAINRSFYRDRAGEFSETRRDPWPGWRELTPLVTALLPKRTLRVLDVGCGNGRFGAFLAEAFPDRAIHYLGVDGSEPLLAAARARHLPVDSFEALWADVAAEPVGSQLPERSFSLVAVFGLLHHIPGERTRAALLGALAERLAPGGLLALAFWRFDAFERFRARRLSIDAWNRDASVPIDASQLEPGDRLLRWGEDPRTVRYCHHVDDAEASRLLGATGLERVAQYDADGREGNLNRYFVLRSRGAA
jgi:SAM-dependent methyltransferase